MAVVAAAITVERLALAGERRASDRGRHRWGRVVSDRASSRAWLTHPHRPASGRAPSGKDGG
jgi:hypothetical protein